MISPKHNKPPKKPPTPPPVKKPTKAKKPRERLKYTRRFLWSRAGKLVGLERVLIVAAQWAWWGLGIAFYGLVTAAEHLKENWTIMQDSLPWWGVVIVMGIIGVVLAIRGCVETAKDFKVAKELGKDKTDAGSE